MLKQSGRRFAAKRTVVVAIVVAGLGVSSAPAFAVHEDKVTICHRTNATKNPYVAITVARSSVDGVAGKGRGDHMQEHTGPIWSPGDPNGGDWGDIIPPIPGVHSGQNWTPEGEEIWNNGCNARFVLLGTEEDTDGDNIPNSEDGDDNGDGVIDPKSSDEESSTPPSTAPDTDGDGVEDSSDPDDDGDGVADTQDPDSNGDGTPETEQQRLLDLPKLVDVGENNPEFVIARASTASNTGNPVKVRVVCVPLSSMRARPAGDVSSTRCVVAKKKSRTLLRVLGAQPVRVQVTWSVDASGVYRPETVVKTITVR